MQNKVFVTDVGILSPLGNDWKTFEANMFAGRSGIKDVRGTHVAKDFPVPHAGVIDDSGLPSAADIGLPPNSQSNNWRFTMLSSMQAIEKLSPEHKVDAVIYGSAGGIHFDMVIETFKGFDPKSFDWNRTRSESGVELVGKYISERQGKEIPKKNLISMNSACASGNHGIGLAYQYIQAGLWDRCLVTVIDCGGWPAQLMNFHLLHALTTADVPSERASTPFSAKRAGFVKAEASASILLESEKAAQARGAKPLAEVCGFGLTSDAYRVTDGREDGLCVAKAMSLAMETAGIGLDQVDYINAHGTSTPLNDRVETFAIKKVFGDRAYKIPVSSLKSQTGHSTVAAGGMEAIACVSMLLNQKLAPTINYEVPDPECDLDYVPNVTRPAKVDYILSNNLGFGGQNASLVFGRVGR